MSYHPAGFFVLRSPLLPYEELAAWSAGLRAPAALDESEDLETAIAEDRAALRARLRDLVERPEVREALFVASPDLRGSFETWLREPDGRRGQRVERAIVRYLERMAARSTPFGLFAGCAVGSIDAAGAGTRLGLPPRAEYRRHTRLDMHYLCGLIRALEADEAIRAALRYRPTTSLARLARRWVWVELTPDDTAHSHRHHRVEATPALDALIERARAGLSLAELEASPGFSPSLLERRCFVSDLEPAVTGPEPIHPLLSRLEALAAHAPAAAEAAETLRAIRHEIAGLDAGGLGADVEVYQSALVRLRSLPGAVDPSKLWQGELIKTPADSAGPDALTLGADVLAEIERGVRILQRLHYPHRDHLARFRDAFVSRYEGIEARREVPLLEALDPELGLDFGPSTGHDGSLPLLETLEQPGKPGDRTLHSGDRHTFLFRRLAEALAADDHELALDDADLDRLANPAPPPLPDAFSATGSLVAASTEAVADGRFCLLLTGIAGPSGARLSGRFCHGDPALRDCVQAYLRTEEALRPDVTFAEIAHLPEPRAGNIIHRPVFRDYEIPYLAASALPPERQIPLDDLLVSVDGERIVLRSARLGREVVPRLTCAQNYFHPRTTTIFRFLAALQDQGVSTALSWDWGPLALAPFLPRVRTGRLVLARARWRLDQDEAKTLGEATGAELYRATRAWCARRGIPRYVRLADYDNELLVDFDNVISVEGFAQLLKGRDGATLVEAFPAPDDLCVSGPEGRYFHELSVPFVGDGSRGMGDGERSTLTGTERPSASSTSSAPHDLSPVTHHPRMFPPGSEWLYAKLYAAPSMLDPLLRRLVRPLVDRALGSGAAAGWFFIRYGDPDWHLRLRFRGDPSRLLRELLPALSDAAAPLLASGEILRLQLDTYDPECERYGGPIGLPLCQEIFQVDSTTVLEIVEVVDDEALADARWKLAVPAMDCLLEGLGLSLEEKLGVLRTVRDSFAQEHHADQKMLRQIGERYRVERPGVESLFDPGGAVDGSLTGGRAAVGRLAERIAPIGARLRAAAARGELTLPMVELAPSLLHMHANRLLRSDQRRQEMVLYDFLYRLYDASAARARAAEAR